MRQIQADKSMEKETNKKEKNPWEHTIALPQTTYPMRADLAKRENDILTLWKKENLFKSNMLPWYLFGNFNF